MMIAWTECGFDCESGVLGKRMGRCEGALITQSAVRCIGGAGDGSTETDTPSGGILDVDSGSDLAVGSCSTGAARTGGSRTSGCIGRPRICPPPHTAQTLSIHPY